MERFLVNKRQLGGLLPRWHGNFSSGSARTCLSVAKCFACSDLQPNLKVTAQRLLQGLGVDGFCHRCRSTVSTAHVSESGSFGQPLL